METKPGPILAIVGGVLMFISLFVRRVSVEGDTGLLAGFSASDNVIAPPIGKFFLILALVCIAGGVLVMIGQSAGWIVGLVAGILGVLSALLIMVGAFSDASDVEDVGLAGVSASVGFGVWLALIAAIIALVGAIMSRGGGDKVDMADLPPPTSTE